MKLRNFYFHVNKEDFPSEMIHQKLEKIVRSRFQTNFSSDFDFQTDFFSRHLELKLRRLKYEGSFKTLLIKPSQSYQIKSSHEALEISIPFDIKKYSELYTEPNLYPLQLNTPINPVLNINEFNIFLFDMIMGALKYGESMKVDLPINYLKKELMAFKKNNFISAWYHRRKAFKEIGISSRLYCVQNCNYFSAQLIVLKKNKEIYRTEIKREKPSYLCYRLCLGEIRLSKDKLLIVDSLNDYLPKEDRKTIFELSLISIL